MKSKIHRFTSILPLHVAISRNVCCQYMYNEYTYIFHLHLLYILLHIVALTGVSLSVASKLAISVLMVAVSGTFIDELGETVI